LQNDADASVTGQANKSNASASLFIDINDDEVMQRSSSVHLDVSSTATTSTIMTPSGKVTIIREPLGFHLTLRDYPDPSDEARTESLKKYAIVGSPSRQQHHFIAD
jgi:hypothetical protein